jgi:hypothetical protein
LEFRSVSFTVELVVSDPCGVTRLSENQNQTMMESLVTSRAIDLPNVGETNVDDLQS